MCFLKPMVVTEPAGGGGGEKGQGPEVQTQCLGQTLAVGRPWKMVVADCTVGGL